MEFVRERKEVPQVRFLLLNVRVLQKHLVERWFQVSGGTLFAGYLCLLGMVYGVITIFTRDRKGGAE